MKHYLVWGKSGSLEAENWHTSLFRGKCRCTECLRLKVKSQVCGVKKIIRLCQCLFFTYYVNPLIGTIMLISVPLSNVYHQMKKVNKTEILAASVQMSRKGRIIMIYFLLSLTLLDLGEGGIPPQSRNLLNYA